MLSGLIVKALVFSEGATAPWWNIPSFEAWRWFNLIAFVVLFILILRRPTSQAMKARRESIRRDLRRAQQERDEALAKLHEVEARLERLNEEVEHIHKESAREASEEQARIKADTERDIRKMREQGQREIESAGKAARQELRDFAAQQSVRLAGEMIRLDISPEDDARLVTMRLEELEGARN